jgi:glutathione S-transferase
MKLYYAPASPFVRKVNVFAMEIGLDKKIEWVRTNPWQAEDKLTAENPLSKIPTLITDDDKVIYDSRVICEYLDSMHNGDKLIPEKGEKHWQVLRLQALADGILDAGILRFMEMKRPSELRSKDWDNMQTVACLLGWLDFRFADEDWRTRRPQLKNWFELFSKRPSMVKTMPTEAK